LLTLVVVAFFFSGTPFASRFTLFSSSCFSSDYNSNPDPFPLRPSHFLPIIFETVSTRGTVQMAPCSLPRQPPTPQVSPHNESVDASRDVPRSRPSFLFKGSPSIPRDFSAPAIRALSDSCAPSTCTAISLAPQKAPSPLRGGILPPPLPNQYPEVLFASLVTFQCF